MEAIRGRNKIISNTKRSDKAMHHVAYSRLFRAIKFDKMIYFIVIFIFLTYDQPARPKKMAVPHTIIVNTVTILIDFFKIIIDYTYSIISYSYSNHNTRPLAIPIYCIPTPHQYIRSI